jgi:hypothetical protein
MDNIVTYALLAVLVVIVLMFFIGKMIKTSEWIVSIFFSVMWWLAGYFTQFVMCILAFVVYDMFIRKTVLHFSDQGQIQAIPIKEEHLSGVDFLYSMYNRWFT